LLSKVAEEAQALTNQKLAAQAVEAGQALALVVDNYHKATAVAEALEAVTLAVEEVVLAVAVVLQVTLLQVMVVLV
jgi:hypothetical protein